MQLKQQVVSLDLAKQLKKLNVPQQSLFWWVDDQLFVPTDQNHELCAIEYAILNFNKSKNLSAYSVAELGEMCLSKNYRLESDYIEGNKWQCRIVDHLSQNVICNTLENSEADARAKTLIYLIENKLLDPKEIVV